MTQEQHPITPPVELMEKWARDAVEAAERSGDIAISIATQAARWGADQELHACCEWLLDGRWENLSQVINLRSARRPRPLSLKEQGREALQRIHNAVVMETGGRELDVLKEIVESLPD